MLGNSRFPIVSHCDSYEVLHFIRDWAPPYPAIPVRVGFDSHFTGRWIGRWGPTAWPIFDWSHALYVLYIRYTCQYSVHNPLYCLHISEWNIMFSERVVAIPRYTVGLLHRIDFNPQCPTSHPTLFGSFITTRMLLLLGVLARSTKYHFPTLLSSIFYPVLWWNNVQ